MSRWIGVLLLTVLGLTNWRDVCATPVASHPRLWITANDLPRLRQWAVSSNPVYQQGLHALALSAAQGMDSGAIPGNDNGGTTYSPVNTEEYAAMFALMALVDPDPAARAVWAQRSRTLLFYVLDRVDTCMRAQPPSQSGAYCSVAFSVSDRSRWTGAAFGLAADWLQAATNASGQPVLSAADRAQIRRIFLIWSNVNLEAYPNPYNNPPEYSLPVGTLGTPLLRLQQDLRHYRLRFSGNNYFAGHMRNMGFMALSVDSADDVHDPLAPATYLKPNGSGNVVAYMLDDSNGRLRGFLTDVIGGWLFMQDYLLRNDGRGGLPLEGLEYAPTSNGIPAQFLLGLETAGFGDLAAQTLWGAQVAGLSNNPFYRNALSGFVHSLSPLPVSNANYGLVYQPAWYGDGEHYYQNDPIDIIGPIALHAMRINDQSSVDLARWVQRNVPPGGAAGFASRTRSTGSSGYVLSDLLYFLMFDPAQASSAPNFADPRPALADNFWSEGMGRLLSRTDWASAARWFSFRLSWDSVDHQHGDGLMFELYRKGEWLTKSALGYGLEGGASDYKNTLAVQNTIWSGINPEGARARRLERGSQMPQNGAAGDPQVFARSENSQYSQVTGDATNLYNAYYDAFDPTPQAQRALDVQHVSRSILWIKPEVIVVYDRVRTATAGRYKRFWLNLPDRLPSFPLLSGSNVTALTPGGQQLFVSSVLPAAKTLSIITGDAGISPARGNMYALGAEDPFLQQRPYVDPVSGQPVPGVTETFATRLQVQANGGPADTRFLTVLQGADSGAIREPVAAVASGSVAGCATPAAAFEGTTIGVRAVLFARDLAPARDCLEYTVSNSITEHLLVGFAPYAGFALSLESIGAQQRLTLTPGGPWQADEGGVLRLLPAQTPVATSLAVFEPTTLEFGTVGAGSSRELMVTLTNRGQAALDHLLFSLEGDSGYSTSGACLVGGLNLAPGASCQFSVNFSATSLGFRGARLRLTSNSAQNATPIALTAVAESNGDSIFRNGFD